MVLFRNSAGAPVFARPRPGAEPDAGDLDTVLARERDLGGPEAVEWVHDVTPGLLALAEAAGLEVLRAPLLVLDRAAPPPRDDVRFLDPGDRDFPDDLALRHAIAMVAFGGGTDDDLDGLVRIPPADELDAAAEDIRAGAIAHALLGRACGGGWQRAGDVIELVGIATLPEARRQGLAQSMTAALARNAVGAGADLVFLTAGSEDTARIYGRAGFRRIGTACVATRP